MTTIRQPMPSLRSVASSHTIPPVAALLRAYRNASGLTQEELAERAGISARAVSDIERGLKRRPQRDTLRLLADALHLPAGERAHFEAVARGWNLMVVADRPEAEPDVPTNAIPPSPYAWQRDMHAQSGISLPSPLTPLIGREAETAHLATLLRARKERLITVTGPGGVGKTRLALAAARDALSTFADGAHFISLAAVTNSDTLATALAGALNVREVSSVGLWAALRASLAGRHLLLILDNCEQLAPAMREIAALLTDCPHVTALVTSRTVLHLYGERIVTLPPLLLPPVPQEPPASDAAFAALAANPAIALFTERARALIPSFTLTARTIPAVAAIVTRLDGLPLALELAAARISLLSPVALRDQLMLGALPVLTDGAHDQPDRQRTLRAAIAWSDQLLIPDERLAFARLSVFAGGFSPDAAIAVCNVALTDLAALAGHSLLCIAHERDDAPRLSMLETLREYAAEQLTARGETMDLQRSHAHWYAEFAAQGGADAPRKGQGVWLAALDRERDNLRAALEWCTVHDGERALRLANVLTPWWERGGSLTEGLRYLATVLAHTNDTDAKLRARALSGAGVLAHLLGEYDRAEAYHAEAETLFVSVGDDAGVGEALGNRGATAYRRGNLEHAAALLDASIRIFRKTANIRGLAAAVRRRGLVADARGNLDEADALHTESLLLERRAGNTRGIAASLNNLAGVAGRRANYPRAAALFTESLTLAREIDDREGIALALANLGHVASLTGDLAQARAHHEESIALRRELGDRQRIAASLANLGHVALLASESDEAASRFIEALHLARTLDAKGGIASAIGGLGSVAAAQGDWIRAARFLGAANAARLAIGLVAEPNEAHGEQIAIDITRSALGEEAFAVAWGAGESLTAESALDEIAWIASLTG